MFRGNVSYETADETDRKKLVAVFVIAVMLFTLHLVLAVRTGRMMETTATVINCKKYEYSSYSRKLRSNRKTTSYSATVEYTVQGRTYQKWVTVDGPKEAGAKVQIFYDPKRPSSPTSTKKVWPVLVICLFHLFVMVLTGIPASVIKRLLGSGD